MVTLRGRLLWLLTATLVISGAMQGGPASASTQTAISAGHVDAFAVRLESNQLAILVKDTTGPTPVWRAPGDLVLVVKEGARTSVPDGPRFAFLGPPGSAVWVLPQVENPALLWPGWNTQEIGGGVLGGDSVRWTLAAIQGPGAFHLFTTDQFGAPVVLFRSADGLPDSISVPVASHAHGNWAFKAPGRYMLSFQASATTPAGAPLSASATLAFDVQGADPGPPAPPASQPPAPAPPANVMPGPSTLPPPPPPLAAAAPAESPPGEPAGGVPEPVVEATPEAQKAPIDESVSTPTGTNATASELTEGSDDGEISWLPILLGAGLIAAAALGVMAWWRHRAATGER
jgi:surface-anchored protein